MGKITGITQDSLVRNFLVTHGYFPNSQHKNVLLVFIPKYMQRVDSLEKTLMLGGVGGRRRRGRQRMRWLMASLTRSTWVWVNSGSWWWTGRPGVLPFMGSQRVGHDWATELNWTDILKLSSFLCTTSLVCPFNIPYVNFTSVLTGLLAQFYLLESSSIQPPKWCTIPLPRA